MRPVILALVLSAATVFVACGKGVQSPTPVAKQFATAQTQQELSLSEETARSFLYQTYSQALDFGYWQASGVDLLRLFGEDFLNGFTNPLAVLRKGAVAEATGKYSAAELAAKEVTTLGGSISLLDISSGLSWAYANTKAARPDLRLDSDPWTQIADIGALLQSGNFDAARLKAQALVVFLKEAWARGESSPTLTGEGKKRTKAILLSASDFLEGELAHIGQATPIASAPNPAHISTPTPTPSPSPSPALDATPPPPAIHSKPSEPVGRRWAKSYGHVLSDMASAVREIPDGGYIFVGYTDPARGRNIWAVRLDADGDIVWQKRFDGPGLQTASDVWAIPDGGFVLSASGIYHGFGPGVGVLKLDRNGDIEWQRVYEASALGAVHPTGDGGYLVVTGDLVKLNREGEVAWRRSYPLSVNSIIETKAGDFIAGGAAGPELALARIDANGSILWGKTFDIKGFGFRPYQTSLRVTATTAGGYVAAGSIEDQNRPDEKHVLDALVMKVSESGEVEWASVYGTPYHDTVYSVSEAQDGGFVFAGFAFVDQGSQWDFWLVKLDKSGIIEWQKLYGGTAYDIAYSVQATQDGGFILAGRTFSFGAGSHDAWVLKLDSGGNLAPWVRPGQATARQVIPVVRDLDTKPLEPGASSRSATLSLVAIPSNAEVKQQAP